MSYSVLHIANKIISSVNTEQGDLISNLKLQKLLYYVQGFNIAVFDKPLFDNDFEAWQYGPVVPDMYFHFNKLGSNSIKLSANDKLADLSEEEQYLFDEVLGEYGQFSAIRLMEMTHDELPWISVFKKNPKGIISKNLLSEYFKTQIIE